MRVSLIKATDGSFVLEVIGGESGPTLETFDDIDEVVKRLRVVFN